MVEVRERVLTGELIATEEADLFYGRVGGLQGAAVDLLGGDDTLNGTNVIDGGKGIEGSIVFGNDGDDIIIGNATGANSIGIDDSLIRGGAGNDIIIAEGTAAGITGAIIDGDEGDDIIRVKNGVGTVIGGDGNDRLRLEGVFADYVFTPLFDLAALENEAGEIVVSDEITTFFKIEGANTELLAFNFEEFQFEGELDSIIRVPDLALSGDA